MAQPTVTTEVHQVLNVALNLAAQLTHHLIVLLDVVTNLTHFAIGERLALRGVGA